MDGHYCSEGRGISERVVRLSCGGGVRELEDIVVDEPDTDLLDDIDDLLDEIDAVLEDQSMLTGYRQRPGQ